VSERYDRRLLRESAAARPHFAAAAVLGAVTAVVTVAQAAVLAHVIARAAFHHGSLGSLTRELIVLAVLFAVKALLAGGFELSGKLAAFRVLDELRGRLARRFLIERPGLQRSERTGELAAVAVQGVDGLEDYFSGYLPSFVMATCVPIAILIWVLRLDLATAIILAVTIPILVVFMILIGLSAESITRKRWQTLSLLSSHFLDVVRGLETLRAFRRERAQASILADVGERYRRRTMGTLRLAFTSALVLEACAMIGTALVAATIGVQLTTGHLQFENGLCVLLLTPELYSPLRQVGAQFHASADGLAAVAKMLDVLDQPGAISEPDEPLPAPDPREHELCFEGVSVTYPGRAGPGLPALDLELEPGRLLALIGPSGAGKSTVARLALRLQDPTEGAVSCGGVDLRRLSPEAWRRRTAWVPQKVKLFAGTLADNIALAEPQAQRQRVQWAARAAGLEPLLAGLPQGLDTVVGDGGRRLSGGEAQRVALARAFLSDPSLVVLDEPTANLDRATGDAVAESIIELAKGRTMLLITHDRRLAERAERIVELKLPEAETGVGTEAAAGAGVGAGADAGAGTAALGVSA
jgi:thiol reductant ABC exporter CydD subunit